MSLLGLVSQAQVDAVLVNSIGETWNSLRQKARTTVTSVIASAECEGSSARKNGERLTEERDAMYAEVDAKMTPQIEAEEKKAKTADEKVKKAKKQKRLIG